MGDREYYTSGDIAKILNVSLRTVRYYDEIGLIKPSYKDNDTNQRFYTRFQVINFEIVNLLKELKFPLKEIKKLHFTNPDFTIDSFREQLNKNELEIERLKRSNHIIRQWIFGLNWYKVNDIETYIETPLIKTLPSRRVAYIRKESANDFKNRLLRFREFYKLMANIDFESFGSFIYIYHNEDNELKSNKIDYEICQEVSSSFNSDKIKTRYIPEGLYAAFVHKGIGENLPESYLKLREWMNKNGYLKKGPNIFCRIISEGMARNDDELITEIQIKTEKSEKNT